MTRKNIILLALLAVLAGLAYYFTQKPVSTLSNEVSNFAIKDTASIRKIHLANRYGNEITIERQNNGLWKLNEKYIAREDAVELLLRTFRHMQVKGPVAKTMKANVIKRLAAEHILVEVFTDDMETPEKTYYVGDATMNHLGNFMLLETKEDGRSSEPFIVDDGTATGYLRPRFFTNFDEWRNTNLFRFPNLDIKRIEVEFFDDPTNSFAITYNGENNIELFDNNLSKVENVDTKLLKDYLVQYKKINFESFAEEGISPLKLDSIYSSNPFYEIRVFPKNQDPQFITLWKRKLPDQTNKFGEEIEYDINRMWGKTYNNNLVLCQYFVFDKLLVPRSFFEENN